MRFVLSLAAVTLTALAATAADPSGLRAAPSEPSSPGCAETKKPNVIVILSDDVGYGEYGFQGNKEIPTHHID